MALCLLLASMTPSGAPNQFVIPHGLETIPKADEVIAIGNGHKLFTLVNLFQGEHRHFLSVPSHFNRAGIFVTKPSEPVETVKEIYGHRASENYDRVGHHLTAELSADV